LLINFDESRRYPRSVLSRPSHKRTRPDHRTEIAVDGKRKFRASARFRQTPRNVQIGKIQHGAIFRAKPRQRHSLGMPGENAFAVRSANVRGRQFVAQTDDVAAVIKIFAAQNQWRKIMRLRIWEFRRSHTSILSNRNLFPSAATKQNRREHRQERERSGYRPKNTVRPEPEMIRQKIRRRNFEKPKRYEI